MNLYTKTSAVISSCETLEQLRGANNYLLLAQPIIDSRDYKTLKKFIYKRIDSIIEANIIMEMSECDT